MSDFILYYYILFQKYIKTMHYRTGSLDEKGLL